MSVKRYQPTVTNVQAVAYCGEHPDGQYVSIGDYDALAAENAALKLLLRQARTGVENSAALFGYPYTEYLDRIDAALTKETEK